MQRYIPNASPEPTEKDLENTSLLYLMDSNGLKKTTAPQRMM
jgi:hypothetical protein